ncbi:MAG: UDP-N-acetylglucosamine--N-acetylmuramyl-(pentapeptide) pyrophosphoryl-undecaprenol N-acetylglucosamine transferase [Spirochaetes bacterium]|jgi:UDP-N-acetylglucosamine--N-acetylmuramyl-(pentapeptide) pyrophosphoryl-undecaprenol N-acetylglucosamine transferase|nr:UDP-N-acetylglucosamine--N-acetylmuramyl-(pentapeptide) pyrophosphoryl-undecaprenol N-acetylglucosamine transferase [Spirochaetota bacterium]
MVDKVIMIVGGGTGGHISPGIALYEECNRRKIAVKFLTGRRDRRFKYISEIDNEDILFYDAPALTKNILKLPFFIFRFVIAYIMVKVLVKRNGITDVVGMGGYVSAPALLALRKSKVNLYLCEQNTVPGKVTTLFAKYANKIFTTFDDTEDFIKPEYRDRIECVGNPIRSVVLRDISRDDAKKFYNMQHCERVILVIGGSQGAVQISELILNMKLTYQSEFRNIGIIWSTGLESYEHYRKIIHEDNELGSVYLSPFIEDVGTAYNAADIAISRSGSGVMMELAAMKLPAILIPYPYAAMNHQSKNADVFDRSGAAVKIEGKKVHIEEVAPVIFDILGSETRLRQMRRKCSQESRVHAAEDIIANICGGE